MRRHNSNDVYYITHSTWKVWAYAMLCWFIACIPLLPIVLFTGGALMARTLTLSGGVVIAIFGSISLLFAALPFMFLTRNNKPMATLTRDEFSGRKFLKDLNLQWTPHTVLYDVKGNLMLANPDPNQSRASKLWGGPRAAIRIHNSMAKETKKEILEMVDYLAPYPVKAVSLWEASK